MSISRAIWQSRSPLNSAALDALKSLGDPQKASEMARYHKAPRVYLGIANPQIDALCKEWRADLDIAGRLSLATTRWDSDIHEARVAAAKLLTQARIKGDADVWAEITRWVTQFDAWAVADHACSAGSRRLVAQPARLDEIEAWTVSDSMWVRRAALVMTLPWTKQNHPSKDELAARDRILGWAAGYVTDPEWFIQKSISWWLRSLSKHDPDRVRAFLEQYGAWMKPFALKDAARTLPKDG